MCLWDIISIILCITVILDVVSASDRYKYDRWQSVSMGWNGRSPASSVWRPQVCDVVIVVVSTNLYFCQSTERGVLNFAPSWSGE